MAQIPAEIHTYLAWQFHSVLPGCFRRNKEDYAGIDFPILAPLPVLKSATEPIEGARTSGPFIYFLLDRDLNVCYVGKSKEKTVVKRWIRPGIGGPASHYWTHTNQSAGCVRRIAEGIRSGQGPYQLRFLSSIFIPSRHMDRFSQIYPDLDSLEMIEKGFMSLLRPEWNNPKSYW